MHEDSFLQAVLAAPKDAATLLIYADWLEEQGDDVSAAKCEFLRLALKNPPDVPGKAKKRRWLKAKQKRLQELAAELDADWLCVVSRMPVEHCQQGRGEDLPVQWDFQCPRQWHELDVLPDRGVRFCLACRQQVHFCDTIMAAREHAEQGHCIAVDVGIRRNEDDLRPHQFGLMMGRPSVAFMRREMERMTPDPVSVAREAKKRATDL